MDGPIAPDGPATGDGPAADGPAADGTSAPDGGLPVDGAADPDGTTEPDGAVEPDAAQLRDDALSAWDWYAKAYAVCDRSTLPAAFGAAGYTPPAGSHYIVARVFSGVDGPAFRFYTSADSGFIYSDGHFWPASTIKLTAAVGALQTLAQYGLTGAAQVSFSDDDGSYSGTVENLYTQALSVSSNVAYNRLMEIAGFDEINDQYLTAAVGVPQMVLQRRYTHPYPDSDLRTSPEIVYSEGTLSGVIPQRIGTGTHPSCPDEGNCTTLFEIMEVMRRVTLQTELPAAHRFTVTTADHTEIRSALAASDTALEPGASQALGHPVDVYNKTGHVWNYDRLDHGLIVDTVTGDRFLVAISMPYNTTSDAEVSTLTFEMLDAVLHTVDTAPPLQQNSGINMTVQLDDNGPGVQPGTESYTIWIDAPGADTVEVWMDRWPLGGATPTGPYFRLDHEFSNGGERLLVVRARAANQIIGYRALTVHING